MKQQQRSLQDLVERVREAEDKYATAIQQAQQVKADLVRDAKEKIQAIDEAKVEHMQQVESLVKAFKEEVSSKQEENSITVNRIEEKLQTELASLRSLCEEATRVSETGSDVMSLYPSLSSTLQQLVESRPSTVDSELRQIKVEKPHHAMVGSLEQLLSEKLHIIDGTHTNASQPHSEEASSLLAEPSSAVAAKFENTPTKAPESLNMLLSPISKPVPGVRPKYRRETNTSPQVDNPYYVTIRPNGSIAVADKFDDATTVFSKNGEFKSCTDRTPPISEIAVTPSNRCIIP